MLINDLNYPILRYVGLPSILDHVSFSRLYRDPTPEEIKEYKDYMQGRSFKVAQVQITRSQIMKFPFLAFDASVNITPDQFKSMLNMFNTFWFVANCPKHVVPEIVSLNIWNEAFEFIDEQHPYEEWYEKNISEKRIYTGIMLRPQQEEISLFYYIAYYNEGLTVSSFYFDRNRCLLGEVNYRGVISSDVQIEDDKLKSIAAQRDVTLDVAFFQEDIYNILKYLYFKETAGLRAKILGRGEKYRSDDICVDYYGSPKVNIMFK